MGYEEGCLSIPGFHFEIVRPKVVTMTGLDLDGNEVVIEGDELLGRVFLHELDHLDGVLMLDRLDPDERKRALRGLRDVDLARGGPRADRRRPSPVSLVFFGTPEAAVARFEALLAAGFDIPLVVTQPDRRRGRGGAPTRAR